MIPGQMTVFDFLPKPAQKPKTYPEEPEVGAWVKDHGQVLCHIMRQHYIGKKVIIDKSTRSHAWFRCGILEEYFECRGVMRSVVYVGEHQRQLIDHHPGIEIYEPLHWDEYPKRMEAIGKVSTF